jgi:hypothetical protein
MVAEIAKKSRFSPLFCGPKNVHSAENNKKPPFSDIFDV